jgi:transcriptional regulator with XRE-family HTH domain
MTGGEWETALSAQIRDELGRRGMQQQELADAVGIGRATMNRYLQGHRTMPMPTFINVAAALGMQPSQLMGRAMGRAVIR